MGAVVAVTAVAGDDSRPKLVLTRYYLMAKDTAEHPKSVCKNRPKVTKIP
jgi:hypothetical protein